MILREQPNMKTDLVPYHTTISRYQIFKQIFDFGFPIRLYGALAQSVPCIVRDMWLTHFRDPNTVTPHQRTLLKLLDGYFQMNPTCIHMAFAQDFPPLFTNLCSMAIGSIQRAMPSQTDSNADIHPDRHLPPICEALILVSQCLQAILLREEEQVTKELREGLKTFAEGGGAIKKSVGMSERSRLCSKFNHPSRIASAPRSLPSPYCVRKGCAVPFGQRWTIDSHNTERRGSDWFCIPEA